MGARPRGIRFHAGSSDRGQAVVELALGILLLVTILLVGLFFAETGFWTLRVQQAVNFAMWDATGRTMHRTASSYSQYKTAVQMAAAAATTRYRDFDPTRSGGSKVVQAVTEIDKLKLSCKPSVSGGLDALQVKPKDADEGGNRPLVASMPGAGTSGISCNASAQMKGIRVPSKFLDKAPFKVRHFKYATKALHVCAIGRANGGKCNAKIQMVLDDWGLATAQEGNECGLNVDMATICKNPNYYAWASKSFVPAPGGAGATLAGDVNADTMPGSEGQFFMSYRGLESNFEENLPATAGNTVWETTPHTESGPFPLRSNAWLGDPYPY